MIFIGLGANLPSPEFGTPIETLTKAISVLETKDIKITATSRWFESAPVPISDAPWYVNGVIAVETTRAPRDLLSVLLEVEKEFGRIRTVPNAPRTIDLDLIAYNDQIIKDAGKIEDKPFCIPHPRMSERAFVLLPLKDIAPNWVHPEQGVSIVDLVNLLSKDQEIRPAE